MSDFTGLIQVPQYVISDAIRNYNKKLEEASAKVQEIKIKMVSNIVRKSLFMRKPISEYDDFISQDYFYMGLKYYLYQKRVISEEEYRTLYYDGTETLGSLEEFSKAKCEPVFLTAKEVRFVNRYKD